jgi:general stress protein 26
MGDTSNLTGKEAAAKIKELYEKANVCLFATNLTSLPVSVRPMQCIKVDEDGSLWFFSSKSSEQNSHIRKDQHVQLFFSNKDTSEYLSLYGSAEISRNKNKIEELWSPLVKNWFSEGKDDSDLSLICIRPESGSYWDTQNNLIQMLKIAGGTVIGKPLDNGLQGRVSP